jgi:hypothetical protein
MGNRWNDAEMVVGDSVVSLVWADEGTADEDARGHELAD